MDGSGVIRRITARIRTTEAGCWIWQGAQSNGYGQIGLGGRLVYVHRAIYEATHGVSLPGKTSRLTIDHLCRRTLCCNPTHLELVPNRENTRRGISPAAENAKKTSCLRGHSFSATNTYTHAGDYGPERHCQECARTAAKKYQRQRRAEQPPMLPKECGTCRATFMPSRITASYCSARCQQRAWHARQP